MWMAGLPIVGQHQPTHDCFVLGRPHFTHRMHQRAGPRFEGLPGPSQVPWPFAWENRRVVLFLLQEDLGPFEMGSKRFL